MPINKSGQFLWFCIIFSQLSKRYQRGKKCQYLPTGNSHRRRKFCKFTCTFLLCPFLKIRDKRARWMKEEVYIQKGNSQADILQLSSFDYSLKVISSLLKLMQPAHKAVIKLQYKNSTSFLIVFHQPLALHNTSKELSALSLGLAYLDL